MRQLKRLGFGGCSVHTSLSRTVKRVVMQYAECDFPTTYLSNASPTPWARASRRGSEQLAARRAGKAERDEPANRRENDYRGVALRVNVIPALTIAGRSSQQGFRPIARRNSHEPEDWLEPIGGSAPLPGRFPARGGRPSRCFLQCRPPYARSARFGRQPWAGPTRSRGARRKNCPGLPIAGGRAPREVP